MHFDWLIALGGALVGILIGLTGAGGGSLMTPMLMLLFGVRLPTAIASDLVATVFIRPAGAVIYLRKGTVQRGIVLAAAAGAVPAAFLGAFALHLLGGRGTETVLQRVVGVVLLLGTAATVARYLVERRSGAPPRQNPSRLPVRPLPTALLGAVGGFLIGLTSVGAGTLLVMLLLLLYPQLRPRQLVGSDLMLAVPVSAAAALGAVLFGHVELGISASLVAGALPGVAVGALFAQRVPDSVLRPLVASAIFASGLRYVGAGGRAAVAALCAGLLVALLTYGRQRSRTVQQTPN